MQATQAQADSGLPQTDSLYVRIADAIREEVSKREVGFTAPFPSHRQLTERFGVSLGTIQRAIKILVDEGLLVGRPKEQMLVAGQPAHAGKRAPRRAPAAPPSRSPFAETRPLHIGILASNPKMTRHGEIPAIDLVSFIHAAEQHISLLGCSSMVVMYSPEMDDQGAVKVREALAKLDEVDVDGVIVQLDDWSSELTEMLEDFQATRVPVVYVGSDRHWTPGPQVYYAGRDGARQATRHLMNQGCRELLYFSTDSTESIWVRERIEGVRDAVAVSRDPAVHLIERITTQSIPQHFDAVSERLNLEYANKVLDEGLPEGVIGSNDRAAIAFMRAARNRGFVAGRDFLITGFDDSDASRSEHLTSLARPFEDMGRASGRLIYDVVADQGPKAAVCIPVRLVVRQSSRLRLGDNPKEEREQ